MALDRPVDWGRESHVEFIQLQIRQLQLQTLDILPEPMNFLVQKLNFLLFLGLDLGVGLVNEIELFFIIVANLDEDCFSVLDLLFGLVGKDA